MSGQLSPGVGFQRALVAFHEAEALGASLSVLRIAPYLRAHGWDMSGWVPHGGSLTDAAAAALAVSSGAPRPIAFSLRGWQETPGIVRRVRSTPGYLRAFRAALLAARPAVVHINTLLCLPEAVVARRCGLPVVVQVHELPTAGLKLTSTLRLATRVADVVVAVSQAVAEMIRPHAGRTPVLVVHNGVEVPSALEPRAADTPPIVGTIGTVSRIKGTDLFVRAAALVHEQRPDVVFEHAGASHLHRDAGLDEQLATGTKALPAGTFRWLGFQPAIDVLPRWTVAVSSSRTEAFPLATLDAMAHGVAVVASAVGGVPEQITDGADGLLVSPERPDELARAILSLLDDPDRRTELAKAAKHRVSQSFTLESQADGIHKAYLMAIAQRFGPPVVRRSLRADR